MVVITELVPVPPLREWRKKVRRPLAPVFYSYSVDMSRHTDAKKTQAAFAALAQPTRLKAFRTLVNAHPRGLPAGAIAQVCKVPHNSMSTHLAALMRGGLIAVTREDSAEITKVKPPGRGADLADFHPNVGQDRFCSARKGREHWRGIGVNLFINWAVKPFSMAALCWLFIGYLFRSYLPADQINSYIAAVRRLA